MRRLVLYIALGIALCGCNTHSGVRQPVIRAFDIPGWLNAGEHLHAVTDDSRIDKIVEMDGNTERKNISKAEWASSLQLLSELDLNASQYSGKLIADTTVITDSSYTIHYTTTPGKAPVKSCTVQFENARVVSLHIIAEENNLLYRMRKEYAYQPGISFTVTVNQKAMFSRETHYSLQITALK